MPHFGIAHALALGVRARASGCARPPLTSPAAAQLAPWLAVEVPDLIAHGKIVYRESDA